MRTLKLRVLDPPFAVCRLDRADISLTRNLGGPFSSLSVTEDEVSLVCVESAVPQGADVEGGWRCLKVEGPLSFSEVGILSSLTTTLAEAGVSLFAVFVFIAARAAQPDDVGGLAAVIVGVIYAGYRNPAAFILLFRFEEILILVGVAGDVEFNVFESELLQE